MLVGQPDGEDDLKRRQLMELAIINGTYRDTATAGVTATLGPASVFTALPVPISRKSHFVCSNSFDQLLIYVIRRGRTLFTVVVIVPQITIITQ